MACALLVPIGCTLPVIAELLAGEDEAKAYAEHGLSFSHRASWDLETERDDTSGVELVIITVDGPDSALAMIEQFRPKIAIDAAELMATLTQEMRVEAEGQIGGLVGYEQRGTKSITRKILGAERNGLESQFSISLLGEQVPHTAQLFPIELDDRTIIVFLQVADEDRAAHAAGFDTIVDSLAVQ